VVRSAAQVLVSGEAERAFRRVEEEVSLRSILGLGLRSGYRMEALVDILDPAPPALKALLKRAAEAVQATSAIRTRLLRSSGGGACGGGLGVGWGRPGTMAGPSDRVDEEVWTQDAELWEDEEEWSFVGVALDCETRERRRVWCNGRTASFFGVHREEALARFAGRELELPFVEADWLANFIHDLEFAEETRNERYLRLVVGSGEGRRAVLARSVKVKHFDAVGRVTRVRPTVVTTGAAKRERLRRGRAPSHAHTRPHLCLCSQPPTLSDVSARL
jgi:PAS domain-containing protein